MFVNPSFVVAEHQSKVVQRLLPCSEGGELYASICCRQLLFLTPLQAVPVAVGSAHYTQAVRAVNLLFSPPLSGRARRALYAPEGGGQLLFPPLFAVADRVEEVRIIRTLAP